MDKVTLTKSFGYFREEESIWGIFDPLPLKNKENKKIFESYQTNNGFRSLFELLRKPEAGNELQCSFVVEDYDTTSCS